MKLKVLLQKRELLMPKNRRSYMDSGNAMPSQFGIASRTDGSVGTTVNLGNVAGGGLGKSNNDAGKAVGSMPNIPKGAIYGA
jgi:hypothetical protein